MYGIVGGFGCCHCHYHPSDVTVRLVGRTSTNENKIKSNRKSYVRRSFYTWGLRGESDADDVAWRTDEASMATLRALCSSIRH